MADSSRAMSTENSDGPQNFENSPLPRRIFLFSGKRKSGKDYITDILHKRIGSSESVIIKISGPIKSHWAKTLNLDLDNLLSDGEYKEKYRLQMTKWGEEMRRKDYGYFCQAAVNMYNSKNFKVTSNHNLLFGCFKCLQKILKIRFKFLITGFLGAKDKNIWIVSDIRRKTDIKWFTENYGDLCKKVYIHSSIDTRKNRGWVFTPGIDDAETECDLDDMKDWDIRICNDNKEDIDILLNRILQLV